MLRSKTAICDPLTASETQAYTTVTITTKGQKGVLFLPAGPKNWAKNKGSTLVYVNFPVFSSPIGENEGRI